MRSRTVAMLLGGVTAILATLGGLTGLGVLHSGIAPVPARPHPSTTYSAAGESYQVCQEPGYLTSSWTYDSLKKGSRSYTVAQYKALRSYGDTLPPLPPYIAGEPPTTVAAVIYAPNASGVGAPGYGIPGTPVLFFFEGGSYGPIGFPSVSGDEFIGGSAPGFADPVFNDGGNAGGIWDSTSHYGFSGGQDTGTGTAGSTQLTVDAGGEQVNSWLTFASGKNYRIDAVSGKTLTLSSPLSVSEASAPFWYNSNNAANGGENQIAEVSQSARGGRRQLMVGGWSGHGASQPVVAGEEVVVGDANDAGTYVVSAVSGSQSGGYTLTLSTPLSVAVGAGTPVWYADQAGGVSVEYLDIGGDVHTTGGTLAAGPDWTIEHDYIHDGYAGGANYASTDAAGVAIAANSYDTIEYNCFQRMGEYALNGGGTGTVFDYNQVDETPYNPDLSGNGQTGCGKWWATTNNDVVDNAFTNEGRSVCIWFDNGNTGMLVQGNYFYDIAGRAVQNETGYNSEYIGNLFEDVSGGIYLNGSGGWDIPGSRYNNQVLVKGNTFYNAQEAINIWGASGRSCLNSGEAMANAESAAYCSGGFPQVPANQQYFSHYYDSTVGAVATVASNEACSSSSPCQTVPLSSGSPAIGDYIGFAGLGPDTCASASACGSYTNDPVETSATSQADVSTFTGSGTVAVSSTAGFPTSGQLLVSTSTGSLPAATGAVLSYGGTTSTGFTSVKLISGSGTLTGTVEAVQPYNVTKVTCPGGNCSGDVVASVSPPITADLAAGTAVYATGTCRYNVTTTATPSAPVAADGTSYYDGCMWEDRNISVTGNTFDVDPVQFDSAPTPEGAKAGWACTTGPGGNCADNAMGYQYPGEYAAPYNNVTLANAMMSDNSSGTSTGTSFPSRLDNLNSSASTLLGTGQYQATANAEAPYNDLWSANTYIGDWTFQAYTQAAGCPLDWTGSSLTWVGGGGGNACSGLSLSQWQQYWGQD
jgi:hypothetical protein